MLRGEVPEERRVELDVLYATLAADDPDKAERVRAAGVRALGCASEYCEDGTAEAYLEMLTEAPGSIAVHRYVALELIGLERTGDAAEIAVEAARIRPSDPEGYILLGDVYRRPLHYGVAALAYREALDLGAADEAGALAALAECHLRLGRHEQAASNYERALALGTESVQDYLDLAEAYRALGRYDDAAESCRRSLALEPECAQVHLVLGLALTEAGRRRDAVPALRRSLEQGSNFYGGFGGALGRAFESLGLREEAAEANNDSPNARPECKHCAEKVISRVWATPVAAAAVEGDVGAREVGPPGWDAEEIPY